MKQLLVNKCKYNERVTSWLLYDDVQFRDKEVILETGYLFYLCELREQMFGRNNAAFEVRSISATSDL